MKKYRSQEDSTLVLLRLCTILLAVVSFWATAQGMINYTFEEAWQGYAASLGVQGLLLGLNFSLPSFLKKCQSRLQRGTLLALAVVVLFCSSWFSYLFIAGKAYGDSWGTECRLLAQAGYREELFNAEEYTILYNRAVQDVLAEQVVYLYNQAKDMDQNTVDVSQNLDWANERARYVVDGSSARDIMATVIDAMENATVAEASQDVRSQALTIVESMQTSLQTGVEDFNRRIETIDGQIETVTANIQDEQNATNPNTNVLEEMNRRYQNYVESKTAIENQRDEYNDALQRVNYYLTVLGMNEDGVSSYYVGANLREIQRELFREDPDVAKMQSLAGDVFDRLQSAVDLGGNDTKYQETLADMNSFIQNLEIYSSLKASNDALQEKINQLEKSEILSLNINDTGGDREEETDEAAAEGSNEGWEDKWILDFNSLKSNISGLPVYSLEGNGNRELRSFDRAESIQNLDQVIRYYLTAHNPAQQGLIYLISPYRQIAIFSLFLALLLDIAAFITGVIIDRVSSQRLDEKTKKISNTYEEGAPESERKERWNIIPGLNQYLFLTGDYKFLDGIIFYNVIENGEEKEIEYSRRDIKPGLYRWHEKKLYPLEEEAALLYKVRSDDPQDGVYLNCNLHYEGQILTMVRDENSKPKFLGTVSQSTPVYCMSEEQYEVVPAKDILDISGKKIVVALNKEGNYIIAIYVVY